MDHLSQGFLDELERLEKKAVSARPPSKELTKDQVRWRLQSSGLAGLATAIGASRARMGVRKPMKEEGEVKLAAEEKKRRGGSILPLLLGAAGAGLAYQFPKKVQLRIGKWTPKVAVPDMPAAWAKLKKVLAEGKALERK